MRPTLPTLLAPLLLTMTLSPGMAQRSGPPPRPELWMIPPSHSGGVCFRELFEHPDQWLATRSRIQGLGYADHMLNRQFSDQELGKWLPMLRRWGMRFALEVGAVKPWGPTGQQCFDAERPMWDRFRRLGATIHAIALDEPLCCVRKDLHKPDAYAVEETARFIALVRQNYPEVLIGDIEPYPFVPAPDLRIWIDALQARLKELGVRGMDFFRLDVDWVSFTLANRGSWQEVRTIEDHCRSRGLPFSLILWASDWPHLQRQGAADAETWRRSCLKQLADYTAAGGRPDQIVVESWIETPAHGVPDSRSDTFTASVLEVARRLREGNR